MNDEYETKVLYVLADSGTRCFQEIVKETKMQRNRAHRTLQDLVRKGEVREKNRKQWERGRKLFFQLTDKGIGKVVKIAISNVKKEVRILDSRVTIQSLDEAIANADNEGFRQVLEAIRDRGKDKLQVHYQFGSVSKES